MQNRASLIEHLENEIERTKRTGEPLALAICDIDYFKRVNDTYGHPVGDRVLKEFAERMKETFRPYDLISRNGGEEFVVCCTSLESEPNAIFERFREAIASTPFLEKDLFSLASTFCIRVLKLVPFASSELKPNWSSLPPGVAAFLLILLH